MRIALLTIAIVVSLSLTACGEGPPGPKGEVAVKGDARRSACAEQMR